ncbi:LysM peptidoglycan-binding domain-containing protein [Gimesia algae]|uniref:LysM domain/BON superfamily protein n=1 Tax=Gimesia algae TaxID=2527971 RepID=A0A517V9P0_9PLAN|nr:LysM peptidoglycan-binding domain-containing protein [Gimesia algae]QDT89734.1 LysM domain/BON superfamily protein [Gimesia algae]
MTEEKKAEQPTEEDWGIEKPKSGIAIETKVGLCLICILLSAFGLVVYQKINRPQEAVAINGPEEGTQEQESSGKVDPFAAGSDDSKTSGQMAEQSDDFNPPTENSGFSSSAETSGQDNPFASEQSASKTTNQFDQNAFNSQSEPAQSIDIAANQADNGFQQFDPPPQPANEFSNPSANEFQGGMQNQAEPAAFDKPQQDPFGGTDEFAQQPATTPQTNEFGNEPVSDFSQPAAIDQSGLMEQPAANEFAPAAETGTETVQVDENPFGAETQPAQSMQPQQPAANEFDSFGLAEDSSAGQMQNNESLPEKTARVNITEISNSKGFDEFSDSGFSQEQPQTPAAQAENTFESETPAMQNGQFERPSVSEFGEAEVAQTEERFGDFRAEEFSAQQAESVTTVKRPAAAIDSNTFRDAEMSAENQVQARGLFDGPAPVQEVSTEEFGSFQKESFSQQPATAVGGEYVVQNGENFWTISKKLYGTGRYFQLLAQINKSRVSDPRKMKPGLKLIAPDQAAIEARYQASHKATQTIVSEFAGNKAVRKSGKPSGFFISSDGQPMYRVGGNDTLTDISQKHLGRSSRWYQIYQINRQRLQNPNKLQIGTELQLPYDASRVSLVPGNSSSR